MILSVSGIWRDMSGNYTPLTAHLWPVKLPFGGTNLLKKRKKELYILKYIILLELFEI